MGGLRARVLLPGLAGAAPRGQQPRWRCGEAVRYVARPRQAELRSGARPGRLRRCSALSLWPAWAADRRRFSLLRTCSDCCGGCSGGLPLRRSALGHRDRPRRLHRPTALRARRSSWPGRCPRARLAPLAAGVELGRPGQVVCLAPECTGTPCFVALIRTQCPIAGRWSTEVACCSPSRHSCSPLQCCHPHSLRSEGRFGESVRRKGAEEGCVGPGCQVDAPELPSGPECEMQEVSRVGAQGVTSKSKLMAREMPDLHTGGLRADCGVARSRKGVWARWRVDRRGSYASM